MHFLMVGRTCPQLTQALTALTTQGLQGALYTSLAEAQNDLSHLPATAIVFLELSHVTPKEVEIFHKENLHLKSVIYSIGPGDRRHTKELPTRFIKDYIELPESVEGIEKAMQARIGASSGSGFDDSNMKAIMRIADKIAPTHVNILITGESGTGKEVLSRYIHKRSRRHTHPLIAINCAAIPENLLESELFGHEKGAFTGATGQRIGKMEAASHTTLLLDEVSEMPPRLQAKLLRALQEKEVSRLGGNKITKVDFRLIATSNRDLQKAIKEGTFREDLYFRLNVIQLHLPPLRERPLDLKKLSERFIAQHAEAHKIDARPLSEEAEEALMAYPWPGNVRELENTLQRALLLAEGPTIESHDLGLTRMTDHPQKDVPVSPVACVQSSL